MVKKSKKSFVTDGILEPFKPENILHALKNPDEFLMKSLRSLTTFTGSITGVNRFYSVIKSKAKENVDLTFIGEKKVEQVKLHLFNFNQEECLETEETDTCLQADPTIEDHTIWLNTSGVHDVKLIEKIGETFSLERLTVRQIVDTTQRPKVDDYEDYLFFSIKSISKDQDHQVKTEQLSFVLGKNYVVSFQEEMGDHFDHIRNKLRENLGQVRRRECDFLLFQLLDAILDNYFETIDSINQEVALIERETLTDPKQSTLLLIEKNKKDIDRVKKSLSPFREALTNIMKGRSSYLNKHNRKYFNDLKNSCSSAIEEANSTHAGLESLTSIYFSSLSQKMNETMRVLTTVATIFIPLTFIAGVYGMNFQNMPELSWKYGYLGIWGIMFAIMVALLIYFKKRNWI